MRPASLATLQPATPASRQPPGFPRTSRRAPLGRVVQHHDLGHLTKLMEVPVTADADAVTGRGGARLEVR